MITIHKTIIPFETFHLTLGYDPDTCLFFDIETTGLSPASSAVFLIGAVYHTENGWQLTQYLAEDFCEEQKLLSTFLTLAQQYDTLIHFNGASFDIPYLTQKAADFALDCPFPVMQSIDLYQKFRPLKKILGLERMNQAAVEAFLKIPRQDKLTGKHMVSLFQKYAASKEPGIRELLLLHNHDDLIGMTHLLRLTAYLALSENVCASSLDTAYLPSKHPYSRVPCNPDSLDSRVPCNTDSSDSRVLCNTDSSDSRVPCNTAPTEYTKHNVHAIPDDSETFVLSFKLNTALPQPFTYTVNNTWKVHIEGFDGTISCHPICGELRYFFPDHKNYYYLPLEDQAIHKSIGAYVDKEHRVNAKPQTCYTRKTGRFLPQPDAIFEPAFRVSYEDKQLYFEYTDSVESSSDLLLVLIQKIMICITK